MNRTERFVLSRADEATAFHGQKRDTVDIVGRALFCFNYPNVSACSAPLFVASSAPSFDLALPAGSCMPQPWRTT
jgi:hypothetical protein